jgi:GNAT superfamily N-acetyltransferase
MADLSILREPLSDRLIGEMEALVRDFFAKTEAGSNRPPLDYDWPQHYLLEELGAYLVFTARERGRLVGFNMYNIWKHPHHKTVTYAICSLLGVWVSERGHGIGRQLVEYAETHLPDYGVEYMVHGDRYYHGKASLFEKLPGYVLMERHYQKKLVVKADDAGQE